MTRPHHRRVSRVILLDENDHFLLFLTASPNLMTPVVRWIAPGGGVDEGESHAEGAIRELFEETGLVVSDIGEPFHFIDGESVFNDGHVQSTHSEFFTVRTTNFEPTRENWMENEFRDISGIRWWSLSELVESEEPHSPADLRDIVTRAINLNR